MKSVVSDTHPFIWWLLAPDKLSSRALACFSGGSRVYISAMTLLEIQYLNEIKRVDLDVTDVTAYISDHDEFTTAPLDTGILLKALQLNQTRDPFDRIIAATAVYWNIPLVTKDREMKSYLTKTVW